MDIEIRFGPWTLSAGLWQTADLEAELEREQAEDDDDAGRPGAGAADRGLDLSTDRDSTDRGAYDVGTVIDSEYPESRRTGFA